MTDPFVQPSSLTDHYLVESSDEQSGKVAPRPPSSGRHNRRLSLSILLAWPCAFGIKKSGNTYPFYCRDAKELGYSRMNTPGLTCYRYRVFSCIFFFFGGGEGLWEWVGGGDMLHVNFKKSPCPYLL